MSKTAMQELIDFIDHNTVQENTVVRHLVHPDRVRAKATELLRHTTEQLYTIYKNQK